MNARCLLVALSLCCLPFSATAVTAQASAESGDGARSAERTLTVGVPSMDSLAAEATHVYSIDLGANHFVRGSADQVSVNIALTLLGPDGNVLGRTDARTRGGERFIFDIEEPGSYRVEVSSVDEESGRYSLLLETAEPVATEPGPRVDQLLGGMDQLDHPGGVIGVIEKGKLVYARGFGAANLAHEIPFAMDTRTNIGSTSKQFTAYAISLLAQRGKLSLDDDVRMYLPDLKDFGTPVTIRHLMTHTSGYREFLNLLAIGGRRLDYDYVDRSELIDIVQRQPELQNAPGAEWNYNNTAFGLLAQIIEKVEDQPFPDWMRENVFLPLGMEHTQFRSSPRAIVPHSSLGYEDADEGGFREAGDLAGALGAGGIYTTVADLARWMGNLSTPTLGGAEGGREIVEAMTTPYVLLDGDTTNYGLGLFVDEFRGLRRIHHGGADVAHRSTFVFFPEIDAGYVALSNYATIPAIIPGGIAEAFFSEHFDGEGDSGAVASTDPDAFDPNDFDPAHFDPFAGRFALDAAPNFILTFRREGDAYYTQATGQQELEIVPTSDSTFKLLAVEASVTFHREDDGSVKTITLHQNGDNRASRLEEEPLTAAAMAAYVGRYFSSEVETYYDVVVEDGALVLRHRRLENMPLSRTGDDTFSGGFPVATLEFDRDGSGAVVAFLAGNGRTRDVRFVRVE